LSIRQLGTICRVGWSRRRVFAVVGRQQSYRSSASISVIWSPSEEAIDALQQETSSSTFSSQPFSRWSFWEGDLWDFRGDPSYDHVTSSEFIGDSRNGTSRHDASSLHSIQRPISSMDIRSFFGGKPPQSSGSSQKDSKSAGKKTTPVKNSKKRKSRVIGTTR